MDSYEKTILDGWELSFRKSQLSLWLLLALRQKDMGVVPIKEFLADRTNGRVFADDKSVYRALRRLAEAGLIDYQEIESQGRGPKTKLFSITKLGSKITAEFLDRNIMQVYFAHKNFDLFGPSATLQSRQR